MAQARFSHGISSMYYESFVAYPKENETENVIESILNISSSPFNMSNKLTALTKKNAHVLEHLLNTRADRCAGTESLQKGTSARCKNPFFLF